MSLPPFLASSLLTEVQGVRHAFFTRLGGVSNGIYESLNAGYGSGDEASKVAENRRRAAAVQKNHCRGRLVERCSQSADGLITMGITHQISLHGYLCYL